MKFTLKDYQEEAVAEVLANLQKARKRWHNDSDKHAFSLTATTGAGKTVMAAAVFEALFHGDDNFDFEADPGAVVLWFSDDPSLNEQTRFRLHEASDRLDPSDLKVIDNSFCRECFEAGKVYFLNTQKLGKKSLLVRGHDSEGQSDELFPQTPPDLRAHTIWDTIQNTIEDPALTLYLVLDEAHRGMGSTSRRTLDDKSTIVKRLINGSGSVPAVPVVWGVSATVERFTAAMEGAKGRSTLPNVEVDSSKVQDSGLLKDTINLDIPEKTGQFDTVLVRRATDKIKKSSTAWEEYARKQGDSNTVEPLMVLQVPNKPNPDDIGRALDTIFQQWPELKRDSVAHVLGDHSNQSFGGYHVPHISPERVQDAKGIRILIAKDAISTGWDCPRAEVMVSFRPAKDKTHITQLLGRMVRTPLARRVPGNDRLNSVDCLLPFFDKSSVEDVAKALMSGGEGGDGKPLLGRRVLVNPEEMKPNPAVPEAVWEKFAYLSSQSLPKRAARPVKRLTALAHELAADNLLSGAGSKAHNEMHKVLDAGRTRYSEEVDIARKSVMTVEGKNLRADLSGKTMTFNDFWEEADYAVIEDTYRRASRMFSPDLSRTYAEYLAYQNTDEDLEEVLIEAHADIAALGLVPEMQAYLDAEADKMAKSWFNDYRVSIKDLSDERQDAYRQLKELSKEPEDLDLVKPCSWMEATTVLEKDGTETPLATYKNHMLCNGEGEFPAELNDWENKVLKAETSRSGFIAWYRNPSRPSQDSLGIAYMESAEYKILRPDFIFFSEKSDGSVSADIVDPHGIYLSDAIPKLQGLAVYAEEHAAVYRRIESVAEVNGVLRVLDLTDQMTRMAVHAAADAKLLFKSALASDY